LGIVIIFYLWYHRFMNSKSSQMTIQSLEKGLILLELIEESQNPMTLQDLWKKLGWNKATIYRMLNTFQMRGYLQRDPATKGYSLGLKIFSMYNSLLNNFNIQQIVRPYLNAIVEKTNEEAHVAININKRIVFVDRVRSPKMISSNSEIGLSLPLHATALGKAYLACLPSGKVEENLELPLSRHTRNTITSLDVLKEELNQIRTNGFALDEGEFDLDMRCIAAPIFKYSDIPFAMIGISGLKTQLDSDTCKNFGHYIKDTALEISRKIGYQEH
jgi:IclR family transcriptional regulator, KDG regulon repressor